MSTQTIPVTELSLAGNPAPATDAELRREKLAVLCALDRARLRIALAPAPRSPAAATADGLDMLLGAARWLPGSPGKWARRAGMFANLFRALAR